MGKLLKDGSIPIYQQIKDRLRRDITEGKYSLDQKLPSEHHLSGKYQIHRFTARRALVELENDGIIYAVPGKGRFISKDYANPAKSALKTVAIIGLGYHHAIDNFFSEFMNRLMNNLQSHQWQLKFMTEHELRLIAESGKVPEDIDAFLWTSPRESDIPLMRKILEMKTLIVSINRNYASRHIPSISIDQYTGSRDLVNLLLEYGHKEIACITGPKNLRYATERHKGYIDALKKMKMSPNPELEFFVEKLGSDYTGELRKFFSSHPEITAVFVAGESPLRQTIEVLGNLSRQIPRDISIVCFGDTPLPPSLPAVTCVRQPLELMADHAMAVLNQLPKKKSPNLNIVIPTEFIERKSIAGR